MRLVLGIGNPGARYAQTRHNIGFAILDEVARRRGVAFRKASPVAMTARVSPDAALMKPLTYVNRSGQALEWFMNEHGVGVDDVLVVVDDIHLGLGAVRIRRKGSDGGHNGLRDLERVFGSQAWTRMRLGVGGVNPDGDLVEHVLGRFLVEEHRRVLDLVQTAASAAEEFADGNDPDRLMQRYNRSAADTADESDKETP